jgi:Xaa-Pro aminopeptidase
MEIQETLDESIILPRMSKKERDRRWTTIRTQMALLGVDALLIWGNDRSNGCASANFRYVTHIAGHGGMAIFSLSGTPVVFAGSTHTSTPASPYLYTQDWVDNIQPLTGVRNVVTVLREMGLAEARLGLVGYGSLGRDIITYQEHAELISSLPQAEFLNATGILEGARMRKSEEEVSMLRRAASVARSMLDVMIQESRPGVRECELYARMVHEQIRLGGEPYVFICLSSGAVGGERPLIHAQTQPFCPTTRTLKDGDLIISEFHGSYGGYLAAVESSLFIGNPPRELTRIYDVAGKALKSGLQKFYPGVPLKEVWEAIREPVLAAGMDYVECGFHGHGLGSPEFPTVLHAPGKGSMAGKGLESIPLEENMVFGINIDIHDPVWRKDVGVMYGETVLVRAHGPECLVGVEPKLHPEIKANIHGVV